MNVRLAAKAAPLAPGEFRFVSKAIEMDQPGADGKRRFKMVMSSTIVDEGKDEIKPSALRDLEQSFRRGLNIFTDHEHKVDNVFGRSDTAQIMDSGLKDAKSGAPIFDLHVAGVVNEPNPRMVQLADSIDGGYVTFGSSIGARVTEHQRNKAGGMDIYHLDAKEGSLVGIPMNQRSWTYKSSLLGKAVNAAERLGDSSFLEDDEDEEGDPQVIEAKALDTTEGDALIRQDLDGPKEKAAKCPTCGMGHDAEDCPDDYHKSFSTKGDLSSAARNDLSDSEFACPEKRKYPINDAAHVRAALSRIADPSNDQCGRDKILAAARKMGIGDHKAMSDEALVIWAAKEFPADQIVDDTFIIKSEADEVSTAIETAESDDAAASTSPEIADGQESGSAAAESPETPETASDDEEAGEDTSKAFVFETADVVTLAMKARDLATAINARDEEIVALKTERDRLASDNAELTQVVEKMLKLPLRSKTAGYVEDLSKRLPDFLAPEVKDFLTKNASGDRK